MSDSDNTVLRSCKADKGSRAFGVVNAIAAREGISKIAVIRWALRQLCTDVYPDLLSALGDQVFRGESAAIQVRNLRRELADARGDAPAVRASA